MKSLIVAVCCVATTFCLAEDGVLTVSGEVNWSDPTNWKDGIVAGNGGQATINGSGTVNVSSPVSLGAIDVNVQDGEDLTIVGSKVSLSMATGNAALRVDGGNLYLSAPIEYNSPLELSGTGTIYPCAQLTSSDKKRIYLKGTTLRLDFSRAGGISKNLLPIVPLCVDGLSQVRMDGNDTMHEQEFSNTELNAAFTVGGTGKILVSLGCGVSGLGSLNVGMYDSDTVIFQVPDITSYFGETTIRGQSLLNLSPLHSTAATLPVTEGCIFHVDASSVATLTTEMRGGKVVVTRWADASGGGNAAVAPAGAQEAVLQVNALNGLPVVDFGPATGNGGMDWENTLSDIRDVFMIIGSQNGGGTLLGTKQTETGYAFERGRNIHVAKGSSDPNAANYTLPLTRDSVLFYTVPGVVYFNGDSDSPGVNVMMTGLSGAYDLVEVVGNANATASAFARRAGLDASKRAGREAGQSLAEVVIYNRKLNSSERHHVEAYLMKKWFGRNRRGFGAAAIENVTVNPPANWYEKGLLCNTTPKCPIEAKSMKIQGDGTSYYTVAAADDIVADRAEIGRKLRMMGGKFSLTARQTAMTLPGPRPAFHVDATTGVETDGNRVSKWTDASGGTVFAVPEDGFMPTLLVNGLNGKPVVDFGESGSCQHLRWSSNIVVRSLFFVMKLTNNKVSYLGSSSTSQMAVIDNFTRFNNKEDYLYGGEFSEGNLYGGLCYLDDIRIANPTLQKFDGSENFRSFAHVLGGGLMANAFGCGAYQTSNHRAERTGGLQIAEAIIYDCKLTEDECLDVQAYLRWKWFGETLTGYSEPDEPYTICAIGSGKVGSVMTIRGTAPTTVSELFGGEELTLSAPDTTVSIPAIQGTLVLSNACVSAQSDLSAGKLLSSPGTTNVLAAGTGVIAAFTVKGALRVKGGGSPTVTVMTLEPGTEMLLGVNNLDVGTLTIGDGANIDASVDSNGMSGVVNVRGDLSVAGGGSVTLDLSDRVDPFGKYSVMTYGSLDAEDAARLRNWNVRVRGLHRRHDAAIETKDNVVSVSIRRIGFFLELR